MRGKGGKDLWEENGNLSRGEKALEKNGGKGCQTRKGGKKGRRSEKALKASQQGTGGKDLREEKGEALRGKKGLRGERVGRISTGKGGKTS